MKRVILSILGSLMILLAAGQACPPYCDVANKKPTTFYLRYSFSGLGSNVGSMQPVVRIKDNQLVYTYQQNSYYGKPSMKPQAISTQFFRQSSIDSIWALVKDLGHTTINRFNPCIMSGGIHYMIISNGIDTVRFEMTNTFDPIALKIVPVLNPYLPIDKQIWADEELLKQEKDCDEMRNSRRKKKSVER